MKKTKLGRITAKLLALTMSMSLFIVLPTANAAAEESGAATITVYDENGSQVGDPTTNLSAALGTAYSYPGSTVEISEGAVSLETGISTGQLSNVTIEGAGIDKTVIKAKDPQSFINTLKTADKTSNEYYNAKQLLELNGDEITLKNMTIDGREISDTSKTLDFVPLRLTGGIYDQDGAAGNITVNDVKVLRTNTEDDKGSIQIGSNLSGNFWDSNRSQSKCNVVANNLYVEGNMYGSSYADIEVCDNCSLTLTGYNFCGVINKGSYATVELLDEGKGYYSVAFGGFFGNAVELYTTIPYIVEYYNNVKDSPSIDEKIQFILGKLGEEEYGWSWTAPSKLQEMAADSIDTTDPLYGLNCYGMRELAADFEDALTGLQGKVTSNDELKGAFDEPINTLNNALEDPDWHNWGENSDICQTCGTERTSIENLDSQCVPRTNEDGTPDGSGLYGVRFEFKYNQGTKEYAVPANSFGAYVLDPSIFKTEDYVNDIQPLPENSTEVKYNDGQQLKDGETFSVDVIDISADANATIYAIPFADGVFGDIASQTVPAANTQSIE